MQFDVPAACSFSYVYVLIGLGTKTFFVCVVSNQVVIVSRKFHVKAAKEFRSNLKSYIAATSLAEGCLQ